MICHASGDFSHPFIVGFYLYHIVQQEKDQKGKYSSIYFWSLLFSLSLFDFPSYKRKLTEAFAWRNVYKLNTSIILSRYTIPLTCVKLFVIVYVPTLSWFYRFFVCSVQNKGLLIGKWSSSVCMFHLPYAAWMHMKFGTVSCHWALQGSTVPEGYIFLSSSKQCWDTFN